jgi:hypothetical protein
MIVCETLRMLMERSAQAVETAAMIPVWSRQVTVMIAIIPSMLPASKQTKPDAPEWGCGMSFRSA